MSNHLWSSGSILMKCKRLYFLRKHVIIKTSKNFQFRVRSHRIFQEFRKIIKKERNVYAERKGCHRLAYTEDKASGGCKEIFPMIREREEFLNFCSGDAETDDNDTGTGECASGEGSHD